MNILIVEDSPDMQLTLKKILSGTNAKVTCVDTGEKMRVQLEMALPDLVLLDVCLAEEDGFQLLSELREREGCADLPVIFITAKNEITSKVTAFSLGAEDYIVKPFEHLEVKARLEAKIKKLHENATSKNLLLRGEIEIDITKQRVTRDHGGQKEVISLTPKEFKLLVQLASVEDAVLSRDQLMDSVWGNNAAIFDRTIDTHISSLRKKLGACSAYIECVLGTGYRFSSSRKSKRNAA